MTSPAKANLTRDPTAVRPSSPTPHCSPQRKKTIPKEAVMKPLKRVPHTPQMVVKVRDCPSSQMPIELCYQCFGDPKDGLPPVLLICGLNMQLYAWDEEFCESLVRAGFYVIRYDNRDIGHSTKIEHRGRVKASLLLLPGGAATWLGEKLPYKVEDMAADAWALLDTLHIPCAHLFGISMGGMIAQTAALLAPERTISLTSVMSSTNAPDLPQPQLWVKLWMLRKPPHHCTVDELLEFRVNSLRRLLRSALPPDGDYLKKRFLMSLKRSSYSAGLVRQAAAIRRAVGRDSVLQQLCVPALVVHGAQDVVVPPMHGYRTATMLPYARMLVLKSMGHYFHPAFYSTIIEAFADMAASTDLAKRGLGSRLPSASALAFSEVTENVNTGDGNVSAASAWRRGGGSVTSSRAAGQSARNVDASLASAVERSPLNVPDVDEGERKDIREEKFIQSTAEVDTPSLIEEEEMEEDGEDGELSHVDPKTLMMASMGAFIQPVVADASSPVGVAACRSVMVAVPGGNSSPSVPEAVIVENMFLRTPHAVPSVPTLTVVKKPMPQTTSSPTKSASANALPDQLSRSRNSNPSLVLSPTAVSSAPLPSKVYASPLASEEKRQQRSAMRDPTTTGATSPKLPPPMDGATPYIPCSPSRWHEVAPFPQRCTNAKRTSVNDGLDEVNTVDAGASTSTLLSKSYPKFHPIVVGVPVSEYLISHPMERETGGLALAASATAAAKKEFYPSGAQDSEPPHQRQQQAKRDDVPDTHGESGTSTHRPPEVVEDTSAASTHHISPVPPLKSENYVHTAEMTHAFHENDDNKEQAAEDADYVVGGRDDRSSASRSASQERRENESFLHAQAPQEIVEATTLPSLGECVWKERRRSERSRQ